MLTPEQSRALSDKLVHAVTRYDRAQSIKRGYNHYALGIYLNRIDDVMGDIHKGVGVAKALQSGFNDRLLDHLLKAIGEIPEGA